MIACETQCFHCGEDCKDADIVMDEKHFCCDGCQTVYQLLSEHHLHAYYQLEKNPGSPISSAKSQEQYAYLDIPEASEALLDFREQGLTKITFAIPKIHCSSCVYLLENLPRIHDGIKVVMVDFVKRQAAITFYENKLSLRQLVELLNKIGYTPDLSRKKEANASNSSVETARTLGLKIGLAGFCFGNIMLLSFPEYLAINEAVLAEYQPFFAALNFILALPVLVICAKDYYQSAWLSIRQKTIGIDVPIALGITALFLRSSFEIFTGTGAGYMDSFVGLIFFLLIGKWYQSKTYQALSFERDYKAYFPVATTLIVDGKEQQVMIQTLKKGDWIKIRNEEVIPVDSRLKSTAAAIDYSFVSGESEPIEKQKGDKIYAGGRQKGASIELEVLKKVDQSYFTQLWNQEIFENGKGAKLSRTVDAISRYFTIGILTIAFATLAYWLVVDSSIAIMAFSSVLIIACPCALALAAPFAFGNMLRLFGKEGFFLKNALTVEQLSGVTDIIFDKTGTLTTNDANEIQFVGSPLSEELYQAIKSVAQHSTHPLSQMLCRFIPEKATQKVQGFKEYKGLGIEGKVQGKTLKIGSAKFIGLATTVVPGKTTNVYVYFDNKDLGYFSIKKQYRNGLEPLLNRLGKTFDLHLLSGDNDGERKQLQHFFKDIANMRFNQSPQDKLDYIQQLQKNNKKVLMVGDGLNDAGALKQAEVGIAISNDVYSFSPASDAILDAKKFAQLANYIQLSQQTLKVVKASFILSLLYNAVGLFFAVQGLLTPLIAAILMPLSSISVVLFVTLSSNFLFAQSKKITESPS